MKEGRTAASVQVVWDLCHYGWPDDIDIWAPAFVERFAAFAAAAARVVREETDAVPFYSPVNEISYWAWACDQRRFHPPGPRPRRRAEAAARPRHDRRDRGGPQRRPARPLRPGRPLVH